MAASIVSYLDTEWLRHTVEVEAESLYEAAVLALRTFRQHECEPGQGDRDKAARCGNRAEADSRGHEEDATEQW